MTYQTIEYAVHPDLIGLVLNPAKHTPEQADLADYISEWREWATDTFHDADDNEWQWTGEMLVLPGAHPTECEITYQPALCRTVQFRFALVRSTVNN